MRTLPMVLRDVVKRALVSAARTTPGKHALHAAVARDRRHERFADVEDWPPALRGFEDLAFLFTSTQLDHGIASLRFDEAALLYRLARDAGDGPVVELGRFKGGATLLLAAANPAAVVWSYDIDPAYDQDLAAAMLRYGLDRRVEIVVGDSRTAPAPPEPPSLVFVDGDHTYEGARADYERWREVLRPGGLIAFHDAVATGGYGNVYPGVAKLVGEIDDLVPTQGAGTIAVFKKPV
jgi:predicted O-methyltransferase YrrM